MRIPVIAGCVALCASIFCGAQLFTDSSKASAQTVAVSILQTAQQTTSKAITPEQPINSHESDVVRKAVETIIKTTENSTENSYTQPEEPTELEHIVESGESLVSISEKYEIEDWRRIFHKNDSIINPNLLEVGQELIIPSDDEELIEREIPAPAASAAVLSDSVSGLEQNPSSPRSTPQRVSTQSGNGYVYGYCTWYVKSMRPDLPNNLGSANTWYARASSQGYATGYAPKIGAAAEALTGYMHVAYVTAVHDDGTITISEMNFEGWAVISLRRVSANQFRYIY